ncbi:MAG: GNAT family protein, partial [Christensenellaceae bacterium]
ALGAVIPFFFDQVGANRIASQHDPLNPNSGKVMAKCGMKLEGVLRQADVSNRGIVDAAIYGILAEEYGDKLR